MEFNELKSWNL